MRILFIVPYTPTLIRVRPYNLVRALARRGHRVIVATLWEDEGERAAMDGLRADGSVDKAALEQLAAAQPIPITSPPGWPSPMWQG